MNTYKKGDQVTFSNSSHIIFHLTVVKSNVKVLSQPADVDTHLTKCSLEGTTVVFHTHDLTPAGEVGES